MDSYENTIGKNYLNDLFNELDTFRKNSTYCDIELLVDDVIFKAHRNILYCACDYFRCLIEHDTSHEEDPTKLFRVKLGVISHCGFSEVLYFIYTGRIKLDLFNIDRVFFTADYLQFVRLIDFCVKFVKRSISPDTAIRFLRLSLSYSVADLQQFCTGYIASHLPKIVRHLSFNSLTDEELAIILKDPRLMFRCQKKKKFIITGLPFLTEVQTIVDKWKNKSEATESQKEFLLSELRKTLPFPQVTESDAYPVKYFAAPVTTVFQTFNSSNIKHGDHPQLLTGFNTERVITYKDFPPDQWTVKNIRFYLHPLSQENLIAVAGVDILYINIWDSSITGEFKCGLDSSQYKCESATLSESERITNLIITSREYVHSISLYTNMGRKFGHFGCPAYRVVQEDMLAQRNGFGLYFHGFTYVNYFHDNRQFLNRLTVHYTRLDADKFKEYFPKEAHYQSDNLDFDSIL